MLSQWTEVDDNISQFVLYNLPFKNDIFVVALGENLTKLTDSFVNSFRQLLIFIHFTQ